MDGQIRWLRRVVMWRAAKRLAAEATMVAVLGSIAGVVAGWTVPLTATTALLLAQLYALTRVAFTLVSGPVNLRYLMAWSDPSTDLTVAAPTPEQERPLAEQMQRFGLQHIQTLTWTGPEGAAVGIEVGIEAGVDAGAGTAVAADEAGDERPAGFEVHLSDSQLVLVTVDSEDQALTVLSRLADDRLLVTTTEAIPSSADLAAHQSETGTVEQLLESHLRCVEAMADAAVAVTPIGVDAVQRFLRLEWEAWAQVGPFVGSLIAIDRPGLPLAMQVSLPSRQLWQRNLAPIDRANHRPAHRDPSLEADQSAQDQAQDQDRDQDQDQDRDAEQAPERPSERPPDLEADQERPDQEPAPVRVEVRYPPGAAPAWTTAPRGRTQSTSFPAAPIEASPPQASDRATDSARADRRTTPAGSTPLG